MTLAHTAADGIRHRHHIFQRMRDNMAQQQIVAEAVADLRYFSRRRRGVKSEWNSQFLQGRPYRIEITRVPGHVAQRFGSSEDADKAQFANSALRFLDRFIGIVERDHPDTL